MVSIRPVRLPDDRAPLLALERSFTTDRIYRVQRAPDGFALEPVVIAPPRYKEFPLAHDLSNDRVWEEGIVAEHGERIVGFAAYVHRRWNRRTELWHCYVAPDMRARGIGRLLIDTVAAAARTAGMRCIWLETSNIAYPAIQFYRRLGFALCGLDVSLYDPESVAAGETALYFCRPLTGTNTDGMRE
jgi:ribosomal protein S18 acetylase RimI-like enzyme